MVNCEYAAFKGGVIIFYVFVHNLTLTKVVNFHLLKHSKLEVQIFICPLRAIICHIENNQGIRPSQHGFMVLPGKPDLLL